MAARGCHPLGACRLHRERYSQKKRVHGALDPYTLDCRIGMASIEASRRVRNPDAALALRHARGWLQT